MITAELVGGPNDGETLPLTGDLAVDMPELIGVEEELYELAGRVERTDRALYTYAGRWDE